MPYILTHKHNTQIMPSPRTMKCSKNVPNGLRVSSRVAHKPAKRTRKRKDAISKHIRARACAMTIGFVAAQSALNMASQTKQVIMLARLREAKKQQRRALMTRNFSKKHRRGKSRRPVTWSRANRHVYTNKDMKM